VLAPLVRPEAFRVLAVVGSSLTWLGARTLIWGVTGAMGTRMMGRGGLRGMGCSLIWEILQMRGVTTLTASAAPSVTSRWNSRKNNNNRIRLACATDNSTLPVKSTT